MRMNKRTKAVSIPTEVKKAVHERDEGCCIFCGTPVSVFFANVHYIPRSKGGLGIEENIGTACLKCHSWLDQSYMRNKMMESFRRRLDRFYPDFKDEDRVYRKGL